MEQTLWRLYKLFAMVVAVETFFFVLISKNAYLENPSYKIMDVSKIQQPDKALSRYPSVFTNYRVNLGTIASSKFTEISFVSFTDLQDYPDGNCWKLYDHKLKEKFEDDGIFCQEGNIGCFESLPKLNEKLVTKVTFNLMSVKWCISFCASQYKTYAGLKNSTICICAENTPQDFVDLKTSSIKCTKTCPGNSKESCGGETSFNVYRVSSPCVKAPFSDDFVQSRYLGCFLRPSMVTSFDRYESESSNDCLFICETLKHPLAMLDGRKECLCGQMTDRFNLTHKLTDCNAINSVHVYRTTVPDERCENIRFLPPSVANRTLLTSFPGSGNTWTRYLLERATGYYTGSVYKDGSLIKSGFIGESMDPNDYHTAVNKDHAPWTGQLLYEQTILVMRNPYHAMKAEFNRWNGHSHVNFASKQAFNKVLEKYSLAVNENSCIEIIPKESALELLVTFCFDPDFENYCNNAIYLWREITIKVLQSSKPSRVFYFEDIVANPIETTREMVKFLANPALHPTNLDDRLACLSQQTTGENKRKSSRQSFDPFTPKMKHSLNSAIKEMRELLQKSGVKKPLPEYEIPS